MTVRCSICNSDNQEAVDKALIAGSSVRAVADQWGFSHAAVNRHARRCIAGVVARAAQTTHAPERHIKLVDNLQEQIEFVQRITTDILKRSVNKDDSLALKAIKEFRGNVELAARLAGKLDPKERVQDRTITLEEFQAIWQSVKVEATKQ